LTRRNDDLVHEPGDFLSLAVGASARLQQAVPADTLVGHYCKVTLANLGHLESAMRAENLIPRSSRGEEGRHIP